MIDLQDVLQRECYSLILQAAGFVYHLASTGRAGIGLAKGTLTSKTIAKHQMRGFENFSTGGYTAAPAAEGLGLRT